jgi:hypothetical protein
MPKQEEGELFKGADFSTHGNNSWTEIATWDGKSWKYLAQETEGEEMEGNFRLLDEFVTTTPGEPFRLFKFGRIIKGGTVREITEEIARKFKLPHFKPAIKLGNHDETTPAGGHIVGLEVRKDGLYALPEFNEKGAQAVADGSYRYHSPEVVWEGSGFEDPETGDDIPGPLIVGDALLHMPHLGEAAALYQVVETEVGMETVQVPKGLWEEYIAPLFKRVEPEPQPAPEPELPEDYEAMVEENAELRDKYAAIEAERAEAERFAALRSEFDTEEYGAAYQEMPEEEGAVAMLASLEDEQREWVLTKFKALSAQIKESGLTGEVGSDEEGGTSASALNAAVEAKAEEDGISFQEAIAKLASENPEMFKEL